MTNIWANSGAGGFFALSSAAEANVGDINNLTDVSVFDVMIRYAKLLDREFWQEGSTVYFDSIFTSSGIAINETDIFRYHHKGWYYGIDIRKVRTTIKMFGVDNIQKILTVPSPAYTTSEIELISDASLGSAYEATTAATKVATTRHKNAVEWAVFQLDLERIDKDYSNIRLGYSITFTALAGTMSTVTMIIQELHYIDHNNRDLCTVVAFKRG